MFIRGARGHMGDWVSRRIYVKYFSVACYVFVIFVTVCLFFGLFPKGRYEQVCALRFA